MDTPYDYIIIIMGVNRRPYNKCTPCIVFAAAERQSRILYYTLSSE